jgi:NADPH:quinone reductase-like Zn-dependent oxidoreductase
VVGIGAASFTDRSLIKVVTSLLPGLMSMLTLNAVQLMLRCQSFVGCNMKRLADENRPLFKYELQQVMELFRQRVLVSLPLQTYDWSEIGRVHTLLESRQTTGKIVMTISDEDNAEAAATKEATQKQ